MESEKMQRLNELILDEEKIVTNISVANELKISPVEAQSFLKSFVKAHTNLQVTYLLSGVLSDNFAVVLVKGDDLEAKRQEFESVSNEIIYSIQKSQLIDFNLIASADSGCTNRGAAVVSKNCVKRNIARKVPVEAPSAVVKSKLSAFVSFKSADSSNSDHSKNGKENGKASQKQKGLANFFAKAPAKQSNSVLEPEVILQEEKLKSDEKMDVGVEKSPERVEIEKTPEVEKPTKKKDGNNKKRKKDNKNQGPNKKRKRIQQICDSDSDDIFGEPENGDIIEMSDEELLSNPPPQITQPIKKKVRKTIDKTYMDEEGFVVTKTEYIYASEPEEDEVKEPPKPKIEAKAPPEKKIEKNSTGKGKNNKKQISGKQPTLMNFFKKA